MDRRQGIRTMLSDMAGVLEKYLRISRTPRDFGVGELLYPTEVHMISAVASKGEISVSDLSSQFGTTIGAASQMVNKLVKKGYLAKRRDPAKRSRMIVEVTDRGAVAHEQHLEFHQKHDQPLFAFLEELDPVQFEAAQALLKKMNLWMATYLP